MLFFALVLVINLTTMGMAGKSKTPEKPAATGETKPTETPAPAEPASAETTKRKGRVMDGQRYMGKGFS